jgi:hypothetical protein
MSAFKPSPIPPEDLTAALREGIRDVPRTTPAPLSQLAIPAPAPAEDVISEPDPPLRALPPDDVPKRFTSFRLPVDLDEELRAMMYETRRSKQDLLIEFVTAGVQAWRRERARR